jgi:peroxiredoxin
MKENISMKKFILGLCAMLAVSAIQPAQAAIEIGKPAPAFTATDSNGKSHNLSDFKGKLVVLEWTNPECPFVVKHYESKNMQTLQEQYTAQGVVWLKVNSSGEGLQGHQTPEQANKLMAEQGSKATAILLDASGEIGRLFDAKTTPHMFVIDKDGNVAYAGAIDDNDSSNPADALTANNYVKAALDALLAGKPVETAQTKPYGCSVKYKD